MIESQFATMPILAQPPRLWRDATLLGQKCRDMGCNPGSLDLVIACIAIHHDAELITFDADYLGIALASELRVKRLARP